jgi:hypothetical protein
MTILLRTKSTPQMKPEDDVYRYLTLKHVAHTVTVVL